VENQAEEIKNEIGLLIERLDDLVLDSVRQQLHGEDEGAKEAKAGEKRLSRARNALRRAHGLLSTVETDIDLEP
jgi:hypothetical protein